MGQFLAIGLVTQISVDKKKLARVQLTPEQLQERMKAKLHYEPALYQLRDYDDFYGFDLNEDIFYAQLLPLLEQLYPLLYPDTEMMYQDVLQELPGLPHSEWIAWAKTKPDESFQFDGGRGMGEYIQEKYTDLYLQYESIMLSIEGKIAMEVYGRQFRFVNYTMRQTLKQFPLAGALRMYITG
jgi:hypothetical protein